jgi:hypothetical protein
MPAVNRNLTRDSHALCAYAYVTTYGKDDDVAGRNSLSVGVPLGDSRDGEEGYGRGGIEP